MPSFNDLAVELQEAIWQLVLPYRGIHWVEIEGPVHDAPHVRESIRFTRHNYPDGILPEVTIEDFWRLPKCKEQEARLTRTRRDKSSSLFFQDLVPVVPSVWGSAGPGDARGDEETDEQLVEEMAYTRRCRQLSTYTQVAALLQTCRLSRDVAWAYIEKYPRWLWHIYRSKGRLHRPRPLDVWEAQYPNENSNGPDYGPHHTRLVPTIRSPLDLVVLRLHDAHGRATPLLRQGSFQFPPESWSTLQSFPRLDRVAIEWHPRWADEPDEFRAANVQSILGLMQWMSRQSTMLYWLVDGIPRPNWERDYPYLVSKAPEAWMRCYMPDVHRFQHDMDEYTKAAFLADCNLDLEFEANGRRYYVVFVVLPWDSWEEAGGQPCRCEEKHIDGPFLYGEAMWPEKLRAPARFAYDMLTDYHLASLCTYPRMSFILSWEPI